MKNAPSLLMVFWLLSSCSLMNGRGARDAETGFYAPRPLNAEQDPTPYYPDASRRAKETGEVVLRFRIGADGKAQEPLIVDEANSTSIPRLIHAAKQLFERSRYESMK